MADNRVAEGYQQVNTGNDAIAMSQSDIAARVAQMNAQAVQSGSPTSAAAEVQRLSQVAGSQPTSSVGVNSSAGVQLAQDTLSRLQGYGPNPNVVSTGVSDGSSPQSYSLNSNAPVGGTQSAGSIDYSNTNSGSSSGAVVDSYFNSTTGKWVQKAPNSKGFRYNPATGSYDTVNADGNVDSVANNPYASDPRWQLLNQRQQALDRSYEGREQAISDAYDQMKRDQNAQYDSATAGNKMQLARMGALGEAASGTAFLQNMEAKNNRALQDLDVKKQQAIQEAWSAYQDSNFELVASQLEVADSIDAAKAEQQRLQQEDMKWMMDYQMKIQTNSQGRADKMIENMITAGVDISKMPAGYLEALDETAGYLPGTSAQILDMNYQAKSLDKYSKQIDIALKQVQLEDAPLDTQLKQVNVQKALNDLSMFGVDYQAKITNILSQVPSGTPVTIAGKTYTGFSTTGMQFEVDANGMGWAAIPDPSQPNGFRTQQVGFMGAPKDGWELQSDAEGNLFRINRNSGDSVPVVVSDTGWDNIPALAAGSYGGQCGRFINNLTGLGVGDTLESKVAKCDPELGVTKPLQVGDVVVEAIGGWTGHISMINGISIDPKTGRQVATLIESNYKMDEKITNTRQIFLDDPKIAGFARGSLPKSMQTGTGNSASFKVATPKSAMDVALDTPLTIKEISDLNATMADGELIPAGTTMRQLQEMGITPVSGGAEQRAQSLMKDEATGDVYGIDPVTLESTPVTIKDPFTGGLKQFNTGKKGGDEPLTKKDKYGMINDAKAQVMKSDVYSDFNPVDSNYRLIREAYKNPSPASQLGVVFAYMKMLDPRSIVREGEQQMLIKTGSIPDWLFGAANKVANGKGLNPKLIDDIYNQATKTYIDKRMNYEGVIENNLETLQKYYPEAEYSELLPDGYLPFRYDLTPEAQEALDQGASLREVLQAYADKYGTDIETLIRESVDENIKADPSSRRMYDYDGNRITYKGNEGSNFFE